MGELKNVPKFVNEDEEATWWASEQGRSFLNGQSSIGATALPKASALVAKLNVTNSVEVALRLPAIDLARAREVADQKGIGYQTLLEMLVHEGLLHEARR